jgi:Ca-activated chloride channel homolog
MLVLVLSLLLQAPKDAPAFSSRSELVVLHVSVVDRRAGLVADLPRDAFAVFEDGRPQPIAFFDSEDTPVTVGLVIDSSGSMQPRRDAVIAAGMAFAESSHPADEMFTVNFNENVWPGLPPTHPFTNNHEELREALGRSGARGRTALFDGISSALQQLDRGSKPRKVLIVVSDGGDNASRLRFDDVMNAALRKDVVIYTIGIFDPNTGDANPGVLRKLAASTGGESFFPERNEQITPIFERIARDIRSSYAIGYVPPPGARDSARKVRVEISPSDHRKLKVRTRSAYISPSSEGGYARR